MFIICGEPARRNTVKRVVGTLETKTITSVIPVVKGKWSTDVIGNPIFFQQDNARFHLVFFAIQALLHKEAPKTIDELMGSEQWKKHYLHWMSYIERCY